MFSRNMFSRIMFSRNMFSRNMISRNECFQHFVFFLASEKFVIFQLAGQAPLSFSPGYPNLPSAQAS